MNEPEELVTLTEAARDLNLSRQRLALIAKEGRIGRQIAGRYWVFTRQELDEYRPLVKASKGGRPKDEVQVTMKYQTPVQQAA